jgi:hypothetical protein
MPVNPAEISRLWESSEPELLAALGDSLIGERVGIAPEDTARVRRLAERWLDERWERIRATLCGDPLLSSLLSRGGTADLTLEVATIADAVATISGRPTANVLAVLLLRRGRAAVCGEAGNSDR